MRFRKHRVLGRATEMLSCRCYPIPRENGIFRRRTTPRECVVGNNPGQLCPSNRTSFMVITRLPELGICAAFSGIDSFTASIRMSFHVSVRRLGFRFRRYPNDKTCVGYETRNNIIQLRSRGLVVVIAFEFQTPNRSRKVARPRYRTKNDVRLAGVYTRLGVYPVSGSLYSDTYQLHADVMKCRSRCERLVARF